MIYFYAFFLQEGITSIEKEKKLLYAVSNGEGITAAATATIPPTKTSRSVGSNSEAGFSSVFFLLFCCILLLASGHLFCFRDPGSPPSPPFQSQDFFYKKVEKRVVDPSQDSGDTNTYHSPSLYTKLQVQRRLVVLTNLGEPITFNKKKTKPISISLRVYYYYYY